MALSDYEKQMNELRFQLGQGSPMGRTNTYVEAMNLSRGRGGHGGGGASGPAFGANLPDFAGQRRQKAEDIVALGGLSPEQIIEANRIKFSQEGDDGSAYNPSQFYTAGDEVVGAGRDPRVTNAPVNFTPQQEKIGAEYEKLISSVRESKKTSAASAAQIRAGAEIAKMDIKSIENIIREYQKNPPVTPEDVARNQAAWDKYYKMQNIKPPADKPAAAPAVVEKPAEKKGFFARLFGSGQAAPAGAPAAPGGTFKPSKYSPEQVNELRKRAGLPPLGAPGGLAR